MKRLLLAVFLSGCAAMLHDKEQRRLAPYVGQSVGALVAAWGPPTRQFASGTSTVLSWDRVGPTTTQRASTYGNPNAPVAYETTTESCSEWFVADAGGIVKEWHYKGDC